MKAPSQVRVDQAALREIVEDYARETCVRKLEKHFRSIARIAVLKLLRGSTPLIRVRASDVQDYPRSIRLQEGQARGWHGRDHRACVDTARWDTLSVE